MIYSVSVYGGENAHAHTLYAIEIIKSKECNESIVFVIKMKIGLLGKKNLVYNNKINALFSLISLVQEQAT